ncbi:MAG: sodium ion-translocating decarboxylase subunit beta, partial [Clostridiales bacterium]|nr:sodium ion-translocating decarboxylase subunit beta [Clostridiales bacterium]
MGLAQGTWQNYVMLLISFVLMFLAIVKKYEPMLLLPIAFGMFLINLPGAESVLWGTYPEGVEHTYENTTAESRGLLWYLYYGVDKVIYPPLIFLGIGAMTDFGPLIANPKSMLIGAGAQIGIFLALFGSVLLGFDLTEAAAIAIIGGADGPTAIMVAKILAENLLPIIAIAAYSYMALIPAIQKPVMRLLTTKKERAIRMKPLRQVSKVEKVIFPIAVTLVVGLLLPDAIPLLGMLMLGNLFRVSGVVERLSSQAQNGLINTITIFLGIAVGCKAKGEIFLDYHTLLILVIGIAAFYCGTIGGLLVAKVMCKLSGGKIFATDYTNASRTMLYDIHR